jgi:hypothetical protein
MIVYLAYGKLALNSIFMLCYGFRKLQHLPVWGTQRSVKCFSSFDVYFKRKRTPQFGEGMKS